MIVRNEAHVVAEALASVAAHLDYWIVVDTGSTDGTQEVIRQFFRARSVPGELHERTWHDFGTNRTQALDLCAGHADYAWVIDADDIVVGDLDLGDLTADVYQLRYGDDFTYWRSQLFRLDRGWRYVGSVHEYPVCDTGAMQARRIEGRYHLESRRLGHRNRDPDKYARDAELLQAAVTADPLDSRSVFYLAQSLLDRGDPQGALHWYTRRAEMGGWEEEVFYSRLQRARCLERLGRPWAEVLEAYLACWRTRPTRAEPLYEVARHYRLGDHHALGHLFARAAASLPFPESDALFVAADVYQWRSLDDQAVTSHYLDRHREALDSASRLLSGTALPEGERERVTRNRELAIDRLADSFLDYPAATVADLSAPRHRSGGSGLVTLTITTCKRRDLFEHTVNSFLHCCQDLEMISRWICIDDGSSAADRARMRDLYPFFEFIWKPPEDRGHPTSMNRLVELVDSPYWLHLEDDWQFVVPGRYVTNGLAILDDDPNIGQVLFNANYGETLDDRGRPGGFVQATELGLRYRVHQHLDPTGDEYQRFFDALPPGSVANVYWPHFSLRPSLLRTAAVRKLGRFDGRADHFELEFASRYSDAGFVSAFFDSIHCLHLGPLTSDRGPTRRPNAYDLNRTSQFGRPPADAPPRPIVDAIPEPEIRVVNLDRRPDRWRAFLDAAVSAAGDGFTQRIDRHPAVDGAALAMTPEIAHLFRGNDFGSRRAIVACALSHLAVWERVADGDGRPCLVLEDDARLITGFVDQLAAVRQRLSGLDEPFDLAYLGYSSWQGPRAHRPHPGQSAVTLTPMDWSDHMGGCFGYILSRPGARRLVSRAARDGIHHGIDWFIMRQAAPDLCVMRVEPHLVFTSVAVPGSHGDSNIQHDFEPLR
jgi:GR25 family glycosyltransferase involved in LPS biosynthesis/GT2 family glycosyltransferase